MKEKKNILDENLERLLKTALIPQVPKDVKADVYQGLLLKQKKTAQAADFPLGVLIPTTGLMLFLVMVLLVLFLSSAISLTHLQGFWLAFILVALNLLMVPAASFIIVKRRQNV